MLTGFVLETWLVYGIVASVLIFLVERNIRKSIPLWLYGTMGGLVATLLFIDMMRGGINATIIYFFFLGVTLIWSII